MQIEASIKKPSDLSVFLRTGWENIWKEKTIFLFAALGSVSFLFRLLSFSPATGWFSFIEILINLIFMCASFIGTTYIACCVSMGERVTIGKTLQAVRKSLLRIIGIFILMILSILPFFIAFYVYSILSHQTDPTPAIVQGVYLAALPLSISTAWSYFLFAEIIVNGFGILQSLKNATSVFFAHFGSMALLGIIIWGLGQIINILLGVAAMLIKSNFDVTALATLNYINPSGSFPHNYLYQFVDMLWAIIWAAFTTSSFVFAYVKYSDIKLVDGKMVIAQPEHG
jgi:hypothetical protein